MQKVQAARDGRLYSRFTPRAKHVLELADEVATQIPNEHVDTVHLLVGIVDEGGNLGLKVLQSLDIEPADLRSELMGSMPPKTAAAVDNPGLRTASECACSSSPRRRRWRSGTTTSGASTSSSACSRPKNTMGAQVLHRMGVDVRSARRAVVTALAGFVHATAQTTPTPPPATDAGLEEILRRLEAIEQRLGSE